MPGSEDTDKPEGPCLRASESGRPIYKHRAARQATAEGCEHRAGEKQLSHFGGKGSGTRLIPKGSGSVVLLEEEAVADWKDSVKACAFLAQVLTAHGEGER